MNQCRKQDKYMCKFILLSHKPNYYNFFLCVDFCDFSFDSKLNFLVDCHNECLRQGIKTGHYVLNRVGKSEFLCLMGGQAAPPYLRFCQCLP